MDEEGNTSPISNVISVYIKEELTTTAASTGGSDLMILNGSAGNNGLRQSQGVMQDRTIQLKIYLAVGIIVGLVLLIIIVICIIMVRVRTRKTEYDTENKDTYKAYEPKSDNSPDNNANNSNNKALSQWIDSLPRSETHNESPNTTSNELSIDTNTLGRNPRPSNSNNLNHTLTKTNPYRHKVLTNGSFLNLKDLPCNTSNSSHEDTSRPTTSTEDNNSQSSESGEFQKVTVRRSNTLQLAFKSPKSDGDFNAVPVYSNNVLDSQTTRAIIDTYSGNLFSHNSGHYYHSFGKGGENSLGRKNYDGFSVDVNDFVIPAPVHYANQDSSSQRPRTESVVWNQ